MSNFDAEQMRRSQFGPITSLQPPYSLIRREVEAAILPYCRSTTIGVIAYSPMASGLLTGAMTRERIAAMPADDWRKEKKPLQEPLLTRNLKLVELLERSVAARQAPGEVAIAWVLRHPAVTGAIVGPPAGAVEGTGRRRRLAVDAGEKSTRSRRSYLPTQGK